MKDRHTISLKQSAGVAIAALVASALVLNAQFSPEGGDEQPAQPQQEVQPHPQQEAQPQPEAEPVPAEPEPREDMAEREGGESLVDLIKAEESLERFAGILEQSGYADRFEEELSQLHHSETTIVAPRNEAFDELDDEVIEKMKDPENRLEVAEIIDAHLFPQGRTAEEMTDAPALFNYRAQNVSAEADENGEVRLSTEDAEVEIVEADLEASDGYVHVVDGFLMASIDASHFERMEHVPEAPGAGERGGGVLEQPEQPEDAGDSPW